jgi:hypothetical protein
LRLSTVPSALHAQVPPRAQLLQHGNVPGVLVAQLQHAGLNAFGGRFSSLQANAQLQLALGRELFGNVVADQQNALLLQYMAAQQQQRVTYPMNSLLLRNALGVQPGLQLPQQGHAMRELLIIQQLQQQQQPPQPQLATAQQLQQQGLGGNAGLTGMMHGRGVSISQLANISRGTGASPSTSSTNPGPVPVSSWPLRSQPAANPPLAAPASTPRVTGRGTIILYQESDDSTLSPYQCLARKQLELFEATQEDVDGGAQGRNKPIVLGQVGIRCKWCTDQPLKQRLKASSYYPARLQGLYQAAQNIINGHICSQCCSLPQEIREELLKLQTRKSAPGGGKYFWSESAEKVGVFEDEYGLRFRASNSRNGDPSSEEEKESSVAIDVDQGKEQATSSKEKRYCTQAS